MPTPNDVSQLRAFLGLINFYGNFVKDLHNLRAPLDALTKKDAVYTWTPECQSSFDKIKAILNSDLLLTHYDPNLPIIVAADASNSMGHDATQLRLRDRVRQHKGFRTSGRSLTSHSVALINTGGLRYRQRRYRCNCRVHRELPSTPGLYRNHPDCYK
ncbi:hypothetical protein TELCIR_06064 [Teladorsagia circumcincta]|uniref:RNA-directed DNA polymerase n=1 Tax=Teladorsagia circumcincta TaxID=45464 RepID=A0A2G9URB6_TELCI|nr:hypothetical protein TELCIR_06064 [Teladorsagia circumcincta]